MPLITNLPAALSIDAFAGNVDLITPGVGAHVDGRWVEGAGPTTTTIQGVVLSISSTDLLKLPEGLRVKAKKTLWTRTLVNSDPDEIDDKWRIMWKAKTYQILMVHDRDEGGYYKAVLGLDRGNTDRNRN